MSFPSRSSRSAFTLVELLVVIAIIGVLVALLLPVVQAAREAANRMSCGSNLKNLGLAMHNYHDTNKSLPPGYLGDVTGDGWMKGLLPFIEQSAMYDIWQEQGNYNANPNMTNVCQKRIELLCCPSDRRAAWYNSIPHCSYAVNCGNTSNGRQSPYNGVTFSAGPFHNENSATGKMVTYRLADMLDGTSNTLMMMEVRQGLITQDLRGLTWWGPGSGVTAHYPPNTTSPDLLNSGFCVNNPQAGMPCTGSSGFYHATAPVTFSSRSVHPGGVQVVLGDGSVRFVPETLDLATWRNLSTMADGQALSSF